MSSKCTPPVPSWSPQAQCDGNEWCLETDEGPICECGDDDFSDDWDAEDFTRGEDGECLPVVSQGNHKNA